MKIQTKNIIGTEIDQNFQKDWENSKKMIEKAIIHILKLFC